MDDRPLPFALRELRAQLSHPRVWAGVALVGAVAGLVGPFGSFERPLPVRLAYWLAMALGTFGVGAATAAVVGNVLRGRLPRPLALTLVGAAPGVPVAPLVAGIDRLAFGGEVRRLGRDRGARGLLRADLA